MITPRRPARQIKNRPAPGQDTLVLMVKAREQWQSPEVARTERIPDYWAPPSREAAKIRPPVKFIIVDKLNNINPS